MDDRVAQLDADLGSQSDVAQNPEASTESAVQPDREPASGPVVSEPVATEPVSQLDSVDTSTSLQSGWLDSIPYANQLDFAGAYELLERGGPVVAIIGALSVVALAVILMKGLQFFALGVGRGRGVETALAKWFEQDRELAMSILARKRNPAARVLRHSMSGLARGISEQFIREDAERVALGELASLRRNLRILESTSQIAPLLGLFGTVLGMMSAFQVLHSSGADTDPAALAGGIWVALITTCVGLAVAIPASFALYWFESRIEREKTWIESSQTSLFTERLSSRMIADQTRQSVPSNMVGVPHAAE